MKSNGIAVREARFSDAEALRRLADQLGYANESAAFADKFLSSLAAMSESGGIALFVADADGCAVGWTSVKSAKSFYSRDCAEISGLVVDAAHRGEGIGTALVAKAESWAAEKGFDRIRLRANATRKEAHGFYLGRGFEKTKEQYVFEKPVAGGGRARTAEKGAIAVECSLGDGYSVRTLGPQDAASYYELLERERARLSKRLAFIAGIKTVADTEKIILLFAEKTARRDGTMWGIFERLREGENLIGTIGVSHVEEAILCAEMAYFIDEAHEGKGVMHRAFVRMLDHIFVDLALDKALVCCQPDNSRSAALPLRHGFAKEGTIRNGFRLRGAYVDIDMYGLLKSEYYALQCASKADGFAGSEKPAGRGKTVEGS